MPLIKEKYEKVAKAEQDRIVGDSFIKSYGKMPVHNKRYNQLVNYLEKVNKNLQIENPSELTKSYQTMIEQQLNLSRLKILNDAIKNEDESFTSKLLTWAKFRKWCGYGTPIYKNIENDLDDPNKMFQIDTICRNHDIAYTKSKTKDELLQADKTMLYEIFQKYIYNFEHNFKTGDYKSDFTTWTSSYNTVINYFYSLIETGFSGLVVKNTLETMAKVPKHVIGGIKGFGTFLLELNNYYSRLPARRNEYSHPLSILSKALMAGRGGRFSSLFYNRYGIASLEDTLFKVGQIATSVAFRDKILALSTLILMGIKTGFGFFGINFTPTEHEVPEEDIKNTLENFETLQNLYLESIGQPPIKIGNEWENETVEIPNIEKLFDDISQIIKLDEKLVEVKEEIYQNEEPPEISEEEKQKADEFYNKYIKNLDRLSEIILEHNIEQQGEEEEKQQMIKEKEERRKKIDNLKSLAEAVIKGGEEEEEETPIIEEEKEVKEVPSSQSEQIIEEEPMLNEPVKMKEEL